jgi:hypothetical protein
MITTLEIWAFSFGSFQLVRETEELQEVTKKAAITANKVKVNDFFFMGFDF